MQFSAVLETNGVLTKIRGLLPPQSIAEEAVELEGGEEFYVSTGQSRVLLDQQTPTNRKTGGAGAARKRHRRHLVNADGPLPSGFGV